MRATREEYEAIELRAHSLLAEVPLHDVWTVELPGGSGRTIVDLRRLLSPEHLTTKSTIVRFLFGLRARLGQIFGWDREPVQASGESFLHRLSDTDRKLSLVEPGTPEGPFQILFVSPREAISEIRNSTVHAFSVYALVERPSGYRFYWSIYVRPVGRITSFYMALIDPFRRIFIYPAILRQIQIAWVRENSGADPPAP